MGDRDHYFQDSIQLIQPDQPKHAVTRKSSPITAAIRFLADGRREVWDDLKTLRRQWVRTSLWCLAHLWLLVLIVWMVILAAISRDVEQSYYGIPNACIGDGDLMLYADEFDAWKITSFFEITHGTGRLTFTQAKVIDIVWDIIIGRLGQFILGYISYEAFSAYIITRIHSSPVTYTTFYIAFIQREASLLALWQLIRDFARRRALQSRVAMTFIISSTIFVVAWPTLAAAMTGYSTVNSPVISDRDGNFIPFPEFSFAAYIIHPDPRINLTDEYIIPFDSRPDRVPVLGQEGDDRFGCNDFRRYEKDCELQDKISDYVSTNGFLGLNQSESIWEGITLDAPALNISAFYMPSFALLYGNNWTHPGSDDTPFADKSRLRYTAANQTYTGDEIRKNGECKPEKDAFRWGISFIQVFIAAVLLIFWTIGIYSMFLKAYPGLPFGDDTEVPKGWKSLLMLAESINTQLSQADIDPGTLTESRLQKEIAQQLNGGAVTYCATPGKYPEKVSFLKSTRRNKSWLLGLVLPSVLTMTALVATSTIPLGPGLMIGLAIPFILPFGRTNKSRVFLLLCLVLLALVIALPVVIALK